jgi:hypothetical protein
MVDTCILGLPLFSLYRQIKLNTIYFIGSFLIYISEVMPRSKDGFPTMGGADSITQEFADKTEKEPSISVIKQAYELLSVLKDNLDDPDADPSKRIEAQKFWEEKIAILEEYGDATPVTVLQSLRAEIEGLVYQLTPNRVLANTTRLYKRNPVMRLEIVPIAYSVKEKESLSQKLIASDDKKKAENWLGGGGNNDLTDGQNKRIEDYDQMISLLIDSLNNYFNYSEASIFIKKVIAKVKDGRLGNVSKSTRALEFITDLSELVTLATEIGFDQSLLKKILMELVGESESIGNTRLFEQLGWAIVSAKQKGFSESETAAEITELLQPQYKIDEVAARVAKVLKMPEPEPKKLQVDAYKALYVLPTAFEAGLSLVQSRELLIDLVGSSPMGDFHYEPFRRAIQAAHEFGVSPNTIFRVFKKQMEHRGEAFGYFPDLLTLSSTVAGINSEKFMLFWEAVVEVESTEAIHIFSILEEKLKILSTLASPHSPSVQKLKEAIEKINIPVITSEQDVVANESDEFVAKDGDLELSNHPYRINKNRLAGERDLHNLAATGDKEGFWVYSDADQTWYCLGGKTTHKVGRIHMDMYEFDVGKLSAKPELYHIHPIHLTEHLIAANRQVFKDEGVAEKVTMIDMILPSVEDLITLAKLNSANNENVVMPFRIVHVYGITEVSLQGDAREISKSLENFRKNKTAVISKIIKEGVNLPVMDLIVKITEELKEKLLPVISLDLKLNRGFELPEAPQS